MPNRDHDDSQYNRNEGRFENRDEWRDVSNAGSRDWDRRGDDFRQERGGSYGHQRGYAPGSFEERREQRLAEQDFGRSGQDYRGSDYRQNYRDQGSDYRQDFRSQGSYGGGSGGSGYGGGYGGGGYGQDWNRQQGSQGYQHSGQGHGQDWNRQGSGYGQEWRGQGVNDWSRYQGYDYRGLDWNRQGGQQDYRAQDWNRQDRGQDWDRSPYYRTDYSRTQSNYGARDSGGTDYAGYASHGSLPYRSEHREGREDESWGQQIRQAGQQAARSIKRVFRGPKNYKRSDERIREDVSDRLGLSDRLDPSEIEVAVANGEVTLTGTVQSRGEKYLAEEIADEVSGVNEVNNQLRVRREDTSVSTSTTTGVGSSTSTTGSNDGTLRNRNARA